MTRTASSATQRAVGIVGLAWGGVLLAAPRRLWELAADREPDEIELVAVRALGIRHLVQGLAQVAFPGHLGRLWVAVDTAHLASMLALARSEPSRRRPALASAAVAGLSATVTVVGRPS